MVDPTSALQLARDIYKDLKSVKEVVISLDDVQNEPVYKDHQSKGHSLAWVREDNWRRQLREGWKPVLEKKNILSGGNVFVDRNHELMLFYKEAA